MALDADEDSVQVGVFDYDDQTLAQEKIRTAEQAAKAMHDPETNFVQIGTCGMQVGGNIGTGPIWTCIPASSCSPQSEVINKQHK